MLVMAILFVFVGQVYAVDEVIIDVCAIDVPANAAAGVSKKRPDPPATSCVDKNPALCTLLIKPLMAATIITNANPAEDYMISAYCNNASIIEAIGDNCRSSCAMCCKAPQFNCNDDAAQDCQAFAQDKVLCINPLAAELARTKCPRTCGLCAAPGIGPCFDVNKMCVDLVPILTCNDEGMKLNCMGTCKLDTCMTTTTLAASCPDRASDCAAIKTLGYCTRTDAVAQYVKSRCPRTCQICP